MAKAENKTKEVAVVKTDVEIRTEGFLNELKGLINKWQIGLQPIVQPSLVPVDLKKEEPLQDEVVEEKKDDK